MNLNGIWKLAFTRERDETPDFSHYITVPGCFDALNGYFGQRGYGWFRRQVECGGAVKLIFEGLGLHAEIYWDGTRVGESRHPYSQEEFVFDAGERGSHELLVITDNVLSGSADELFKDYYDFYGYGGIYRDVTLQELKPDYIDHLTVIPLDYRTGEILIQIQTGTMAPGKIRMSFDGVFFDERDFTTEIKCRVPGFKTWSPEGPFLHRLTINEATVEFGIRTIDWSGDELKLNGQPLKLIGYNRHESHPQFGAATPDALTCADLTAIKNQGCNFIRGSHYPQKESMLKLCDRLGLLVWEEALGWGNKENHLTNSGFQQLQEEQCQLMVRKSINHPCVIIWGFLNEAETNKETARPIISRLYNTIRKLDPSRPITYASNKNSHDCCFDLVDIVSLNIYPGWYDGDHYPESGIHSIRPELESCAARITGKPLIISEIGAGALYGDHSGYRWSEEYQADYLREVIKGIIEIERYSGLAMWQFCDSRTYIATQYYLLRPRGFNNKGVVNEYRLPKAAWKAIKEILQNLHKGGYHVTETS